MRMRISDPSVDARMCGMVVDYIQYVCTYIHRSAFQRVGLRRPEYMRWVRRERYGGLADEFGDEFASGLCIAWGGGHLT